MQTTPGEVPKFVVWEQVRLAKGAYRIHKVKEVALLPQAEWQPIDGEQFEDELTMALALLGKAYTGGWVGMEFSNGATVNRAAQR